jgi:hypothetical protein
MPPALPYLLGLAAQTGQVPISDSTCTVRRHRQVELLLDGSGQKKLRSSQHS